MKRVFGALALLLLLGAFSACAETVYVAGSDDFHPIESYNAEEKRYEGVLPEVLQLVSEETGIEFVYIREGDAGQADMISGHIPGSAANKIAVLSYTDGGETVDVGFSFLKETGAELAEAVKGAVQGIAQEEINGMLVSANAPEEKSHIWMIALTALFAVMLAAVIVQDSVKLRRAHRQSRINEMTDVETGIGNLAYFRHRFENDISDHARSQHYAAYIMIDSDYLQTYHHESAFGDVVKYTAGVLRASAKQNGIAARIAENGFALAFRAAGREQAELKMETIAGKLNGYVDNHEKRSKPVFHAAVYQLSDGDLSSELILMNLRRSCIRLSGSEKQLVFCDAESMRSVQAEKEHIESINRGFENEEFKLYLQFIVDNKSREIKSAEALSRWEHPEKGLLTPNKYIEIMENTALISQLDYFMFERVCRQLEKWKDTRLGGIDLSCNFTRITISEQNFIDRIQEIAGRYDFDHGKLLIEITEDAIEKNQQLAMRNMAECKKLGFRIALDDLGSGYTSLTNLCDYPIDVVKIDRDIMIKAKDSNGKKLFSGIIALAHSLNLKVVCEGVETLAQRDFVAGTDCDHVQGWFYSLVYPAEEGEDFIRRYEQQHLQPS